jgi:hypothetical protein
VSESDTITVVVTITEKDYAAAVRGMMAPRTLRLGNILFWSSLAVLAYLAYEAARIEAISRTSTMLGSLGIVLFAWFFRFGAPLLAARNFVRKNPDALGPGTQTVGPSGVRTESARGQATTPWTTYQRVRETRDLFLFYVQSNFAIIVPKRCFGGPAEIQRYREIVRQYCPGTLELQG